MGIIFEKKKFSSSLYEHVERDKKADFINDNYNQI